MKLYCIASEAVELRLKLGFEHGSDSVCSMIPLFAFVSLIFLSRRMALHAVLEIGDAFLDMLRAYFGFIVFMTTITSKGCKSAGVTGGA